MAKKKNLLKEVDFESPTQEKVAAWRPAFDWIRQDLFQPKGSKEELEVDLAFLLNDLPLYSPLTFENEIPQRGLYFPKSVNPPEKISKVDLIRWCIEIAQIYVASLEFSKSSPTLEHSINELSTLKSLSEKLYIGMIRSNYFSKYYMHNVSGLSRLNHETYLKADGESLPRCHGESHLQKRDWYERLSGLADFCEELELELNLFTNPVKGPLFKKEFGTPEFILVWNCHALLLLLGEKTTGYRGCTTAKIAKILRKFATLVELNSDWPDEHIRSILEWYKAREKNIFLTRQMESILKAADISATDREHAQLVLDALAEQEAWLFENAGRVSEEYRTGRGNLTLFRDPMFPLEMD